MLAQIIGIAAGSWSIARGGLPIATLGASLVTGKPHVTVTALAFAAIPVPGFIQAVASPSLESTLGAGAAKLFAWLDPPLQTGGPLLEFGDQRVHLLPRDGGLVTAVVLGAGKTATQAAIRAVGWALLAIVVQPLAVLVCVATLVLGVPEVGRFFLSHGLWLLLGAGVVFQHVYREPSLGLGDPRMPD
jgi:hypothetical protein